MLAKWTPLRLVQLALLGALLVALGVLSFPVSGGMLSLHDHVLGPHRGNFLAGACAFVVIVPFVGGGSIVGLALSQLSKGMGKDVWTEGEVEEAHLWVESYDLKRGAKWYLWTTRFLFILLLSSWAASRFWNVPALWTAKLSCMSAMWLNQPLSTLSKLRTELRPSSPARTPSKGWAGTIKGIYSEYWGGRETSKP